MNPNIDVTGQDFHTNMNSFIKSTSFVYLIYVKWLHGVCLQRQSSWKRIQIVNNLLRKEIVRFDTQ